MAKLVEAVPNFSEGRRPEVLEAISAAIRSVPGVTLLDMEADKDHNRSVFTFVGGPEAVKEAALLAAAQAVKHIDMESHRGAHPRLGALDVLPFVPVMDMTMAEAVELARSAGRELWERLRIPVYFYEEAAAAPARRSLPDVRRGEYEGRKRNCAEPEWRPDIGGPLLHPTAGAAIVGARFPLIAYNINLATDRLDIAKAIARKIREKDGGLPAVRALGLELRERGIVQVSMNLVNYQRTGIAEVFEAVRAESERAGVQVLESELIGLVPLEALARCAGHFLKLGNLSQSQVLEARLLK
jgi:glutamate formiminotransferase